MTAPRSASRFPRRAVVSAVLIGLLSLIGVLVGQAPARSGPKPGTKPTVVLVHGAFADASSWSGVIERLQKDGYDVVAPANPLRGLASDSAYLASFVKQIAGPVLLVGHSYGGAVITNAATGAGNVVGLVYVAAFAPDEAERLIDVVSQSKDSILNSALVPLQYPTGNGSETATELTANPALFREVLAADLPAKQVSVIAAGQRPVAGQAFFEPSGPPAWKSLHSWAVVPTDDKAVGSDVVRSMAQRAGASIVEVAGSHLIMISRAEAVSDVIVQAAVAVG